MPYILGAQALILGVVGSYLVWHFKLRTVFRADLYEPLDKDKGLLALQNVHANRYFKVGEQEFKSGAKYVKSKQFGSFEIHMNKMLYTDGRKHIWAFDTVTKKGLTFGGTHDVGDPSYTQDLLFSGVLKRFAHLISSFDATTWLIIIVLVCVAVLCFALGLFASPYLLPGTVPVTPNPPPAV